MNTPIPCGSGNSPLTSRQTLGLVNERVAVPLLVVGDQFCFLGSRFEGRDCCCSLTRSVWPVRNGRLYPVKSGELLERMLLHEHLQLITHRLDATIAVLHHARAELYGVAAEQDELGSVIARFDATDSAE